nr:unnamed protein product [Naegleria fowleri]
MDLLQKHISTSNNHSYENITNHAQTKKTTNRNYSDGILLGKSNNVIHHHPARGKSHSEESEIASESLDDASEDHQNMSKLNESYRELANSYKIPGIDISATKISLPNISNIEGVYGNEISMLFGQKKASQKGVIKVVARVRPLNKSSYLVSDENKILEIGEDRKSILIGKHLGKTSNDDFQSTNFQFTFDRIFDEYANQELFYHSCGYPLFKSFASGVNSSVILYGQTRSGKSYTLEGLLDEERRGLIPRFVEDTFKFMNTYNQGQGALNAKFVFSISYLQVYNDVVTDLLSSQQKNLKIVEDKSKTDGRTCTSVVGLRKQQLKDPKDIYTILKYAKQNRTALPSGLKPPDLHARSHTILSLHLEQTWPQLISATTSSIDVQTHNICSQISFVELAGSEKARDFSQLLSSSGAVSNEEGSKIARTFNALSSVITSLGKTIQNNNMTETSVQEAIEYSTLNLSVNTTTINKPHIPYRDSKLTHILRDTLREDAITLIVSCLYPIPENYSEMLMTAKYSSRLKQSVSSMSSCEHAVPSSPTKEHVSSPIKPKLNTSESYEGTPRKVSFGETDEEPRKDTTPAFPKQTTNSFIADTSIKMDHQPPSLKQRYLDEKERLLKENEELRNIVNIDSMTRRNVQKNLEHLEKEMSRADEERKALRERVTELTQKAKEYADKNTSLQETLVTAKQQVENLMKLKETMEEELDRNREYISQLSIENSKLNEQLINQAVDHETTISKSARSQMDILEKENYQLKQDILRLHKTNALNESKAITDLENSINNLSEELQQEKSQNRSLSNELLESKQIIEELRVMLKNLEQEKDQMIGMVDLLNEEKLKSGEEYHNQLSELQSVIKEQEKSIERKVTEITRTKEMIKNLNLEIDKMKDLVSSLTDEKQQIEAKAIQERNDQKVQMEKLMRENHELKHQLDLSKKELHSTLQDVQRMENQMKVIPTLETELIKKEETIKVLQREVEFGKNLSDKTVHELKESVKKELSSKSELISKLNTISNEKLELEMMVNKLQSQNNIILKENEEQSIKLKDLAEELMQMTIEKNRLESDYKTSNTRLRDQLFDSKKQYETDTHHFKEQIKALESKISSLKEYNNSRNVQLEETLLTKKKIEEQLLAIQKRYGVFDTQLGSTALESELEKRVETHLRLSQLEKLLAQKESDLEISISESQQKTLENDKLKKEMNEHRIEIQTLKNKLEEMEYSLTSLKSNLEHCIDERKRLREENQSLLSNSSKKEDVIRKLRQDLQVLSMEKESILTEKENLQSVLKRTLESGCSTQDDLSQAKFEMMELRRERDDMEIKLLGCEKNISSLEEELKHKELLISELRNNSELVRKENMISKLEENLRKQAEENRLNQVETIKLKSELITTKENMKSEVSDMETKVNQFKRLYSETLTELENSRKEFAILYEENQHLKEEFDSLKNDLSEKVIMLKRAQELSCSTEEALTEKTNHIDTLVQTIESCEKKLREYIDKNAILQNTIDHLEKQISRYQEDVSNSKEDLQRKIEEYNHLALRSKLQEVELENLKKKIETTNERIEQLEKEKKEILMEKESICKSYEQSQQELISIQQNLSEMNKQMLEYKEQSKEMAEHIQKDQDEREIFIARMKRFERTIHSLTSEKEAIEKQLQSQVSQITEKTSMLDYHEQRLRQTTEELERLQSENNSIRMVNSDLKGQVVKLNEEKRKFIRTITEYETELDRVKKAHDKTSKELKELLSDFVFHNK